MEYMHFYSKEQVDKYLMAIRDGKIDAKNAVQEHNPLYDYDKAETSFISERNATYIVGPVPFNPYYLTPFFAYDCHTERGTCVAVIKPNNNYSSK